MSYKEEQQKIVISAVSAFIDARIAATTTDFCATISINVSTDDTITVHFINEDGSNLVMDLLQDLADFMLEHTGRHYCISNNSPTDGTAIIFIDRHMDRPFNKQEFKAIFIEQFEKWHAGTSTAPALDSQLLLFRALNDHLSFKCEGREAWKEKLTYNDEIWLQIMSWFYYHK